MQQQTFSEVIDMIFVKLAVRYGAAWLRQWDGVDMMLVKSDWGSELCGFAGNLEPLRYALCHLPERCPNVAQFRGIANSCPLPELERLPAPAPDPARVAQQVQKLQQVRATPAPDPKAWARGHLARHVAGERINPTVLRFAREALGLHAQGGL